MTDRPEEFPHCAACHTPSRFYAPGGICPVCEKVNDLLDVAAKHPEIRPQLRRIAWDIGQLVWGLSRVPLPASGDR